MYFASDNWSGATPEVLSAMLRANDGIVPAYGSDAITARVTERFSELFETPVEVWFTATGTASNSLALAALTRPGGLVFCSSEAHIQMDEWGATEFQTGMKLITTEHADGLITPDALAETLARFPAGNRFGTPVALSVTNASERGTVYSADQVQVLARMARLAGLAVHMDGARFANAVAATGASPADLTWRAGVDLMSFGGTKNGCVNAEAVLVFAPEKVRDLAALRQRGGHTFSKSRFIAAQFEAYLTDGLWLRTASHANAMAARLQQGLLDRGLRLGWKSTANEVFPVLPKATIARIREAGGTLHEWTAEFLPREQRPAAHEDLTRLVASWATREDDVDRFLGLV